MAPKPLFAYHILTRRQTSGMPESTLGGRPRAPCPPTNTPDRPPGSPVSRGAVDAGTPDASMARRSQARAQRASDGQTEKRPPSLPSAAPRRGIWRQTQRNTYPRLMAPHKKAPVSERNTARNTGPGTRSTADKAVGKTQNDLPVAQRRCTSPAAIPTTRETNAAPPGNQGARGPGGAFYDQRASAPPEYERDSAERAIATTQAPNPCTASPISRKRPRFGRGRSIISTPSGPSPVLPEFAPCCCTAPPPGRRPPHVVPSSARSLRCTAAIS